MLTYILFTIGFVLLIKGADFLVEGAASIARGLKSSSPGDSHPQALTDTDVSLSAHPAPIV